MEIGNKVKIKGTCIIAEIKQIGEHGLLLLDSKEFSAFDRRVFGPWEVEKIMKARIKNVR